MRPVTETTRLAQQDTMLSPRFYTTDFAAMDRLDVASIRAEWDELMAEFARDANKNHFVRNADFDLDLSTMPDDLREEFIHFLVSSVTSEFSGCVLYAEIKRRVQNPRHTRLVRLHGPRRGPSCRIHQRYAEGFRCRRGSRAS